MTSFEDHSAESKAPSLAGREEKSKESETLSNNESKNNGTLVSENAKFGFVQPNNEKRSLLLLM